MENLPNNNTNSKPQKGANINIAKFWEIDYWTKELGVSPERLIEAVIAVGPDSENVKNWLAKK